MEWEYACRGGTESEYHSGDGGEALRAVGWFDDNSNGSTQPVGLKNQNSYGLYDMHGNIWEWCADVWDARRYQKVLSGAKGLAWSRKMAGEDIDYTDWIAGAETAKELDAPLRSVRGGSWNDSAWRCRSAIRDWRGPRNRSRFRGFRLCLRPGSGPMVSSEGRGPESGAISARDVWAGAEAEDAAGREGGTTERKAGAAAGVGLRGLRLPPAPKNPA